MDGRSTFPLPDSTAPTGERCLQVTIPDDDQYQTLLLSAVDVLSFWMNYDRDDLRSGALVANVFKKVMASWKDCAGEPLKRVEIEVDDMANLFDVVCDDNGDCHAEFRCSVCDPYIELATKADVAASGQPGGHGTPQPTNGGGKQCYPMKFGANQKWWLPAFVSAGDTVQVGLPVQIVSGTGNDGTDSVLYCANGSIYSAGNCNSSGAHTVSTDPLNTAPHMCLLLVVAGVYYPIDTTITIPGGVSNAQGYIQVNDQTIANCSGQYSGQCCIVNNQTATWTHTFDFTLSDGGFVIAPTRVGSWSPGIGWVTDWQWDGAGASARFVSITKAFASRVITSYAMTYSFTNGTETVLEDGATLWNGTISGSPIASAGHTNGVGLMVGGLMSPFASTRLSADVTCGNLSGNADPGGAATITRMVISGNGTDPF